MAIHTAVLKKEVLEYLNPQQNENFVDCTVGEGGHAEDILNKIKPDGRLLGIDLDPQQIISSHWLEAIYKDRVTLVNDSYTNLKEILERKNFGPVSGTELPVGKLADAFVKAWGKGSWVDQSSPDQPHEASILRLSIEKAGWDLDWHPRWTCPEMVEATARWYRSVLCEKADARAACEADIATYEG